MAIRIGINGFGRMGRLAVRAGWNHPEIEFIHINDVKGNAETAAHLLEFDSVHGHWARNIQSSPDRITVDEKSISISQQSTLEAVNWQHHEIDLVLECTGKFKKPDALSPYFSQGIKRVVVAAPIKTDPALDIVYGVNHHQYNPDNHRIVSAASCTTNCLAPVVKVLQERFGINRGSFTTIHDVTNTQVLVDAPHKDLRRARSALNSLIPTTTGSATQIIKIYPELEGKLNGHAVRVPLLNASLTDCAFDLKTKVTADEVNSAFADYAANDLADILGYEERPLVSQDFLNDPRSGIIDALSTMVIDDTHLKVYAWYDNEWGYVNRMIDIVRMMYQQGL